MPACTARMSLQAFRKRSWCLRFSCRGTMDKKCDAVSMAMSSGRVPAYFSRTKGQNTFCVNGQRDVGGYIYGYIPSQPFDLKQSDMWWPSYCPCPACNLQVSFLDLGDRKSNPIYRALPVTICTRDKIIVSPPPNRATDGPRCGRCSCPG